MKTQPNGKQEERAAKNALNNTNKFLDKAEVSIGGAIDHLEEYLERAKITKELSPEERRALSQATKQLKLLHRDLEKVADRIPIAN